MQRRLLLLIAGAILIVGLPAIWVLAMAEQPIVQPLPFNHQIHIVDVELECTDCHNRVLEHARATLPTLEICQDCHSEELTESDVEAQLLSYTTEDRPIPWQRIYKLPDHVYFSHRRHVVLGELSCTACHGEVSTLTAPSPAPVVAVTMKGCMRCHEQQLITNDCLACHQ